MTTDPDSRLSTCGHICCRTEGDFGFDEPGHLHLVEPELCCVFTPEAVAQSKERHPSNQGHD
jgi:hypothetical protein